MATLGGYFLRTHKLGEYITDCQDALAFDAEKGLYAVADGATESFYAREWARLLAEGWVRAKAGGGFEQTAWIGEAQQAWAERVKQEIAEGRGDIFFINSFNGLKPAYATFLSAECKAARDEKQLHVEVTARGDSCLLHFRGVEFAGAFPLAKSEQFNNQPEAVSSREAAASVKFARGEASVAPGERLVLATDAFAKFLLRGEETGSARVAEFFALKSREAAVEFIARARERRELENDDIALMVLEYGERRGIADWSFAVQRRVAAEPVESVVIPPRIQSPEVAKPPAMETREPETKKNNSGRVIVLLLLTLVTAAAVGYEYLQLQKLEQQMAALTASADAAQKNTAATLAVMKQLEAAAIAEEQQPKTPEKPAVKNEDDKKNAPQKPKKQQQSLKSTGKAAQPKVKDPSKEPTVPAASKTLDK